MKMTTESIGQNVVNEKLTATKILKIINYSILTLSLLHYYNIFTWLHWPNLGKSRKLPFAGNKQP